MLEIVLFAVLSIPLVFLSWRALFNLRRHGVYRFITWECILWIGVNNINQPTESKAILGFSPATALLIAALLIVLSSLSVMLQHGKISGKRKDETLFGFEKTTSLVEVGLFRYIRHPMYLSLLCLTWGLLLKNPEPGLLLVALVGTITCIYTALIEEQENIAYFGEEYRQYMHRTKMFIPFIL
ncbi:methyltransferase family protein [Desulfurivibrio alkaliphilus]|uniref:Isoprenylcysteine carboxylmethyltransferase family protein n=1 Tax=Desulfurivibrio alkaliphilus (strain DSM 19089 / UNIQEM U267 / AHT2) TaxID=589865 RepID=D6Z6K6_DESAT|nr:methyltransferase [Desulfurivibrio alkaliphilus]ADH84965.1 conserved hypothetical protein [Desulfurivibrio alkaliphilus AHT 2]